MPRRSILSAAERDNLLAFPSTENEIIRHYTFSESDLATICQRRGNHNRLGFAVQLCYLRYPGSAMPPDANPPESLLSIVGRQLHIQPAAWTKYARRPVTRREHLAELLSWLSLTSFSGSHYRRLVNVLSDLAQQTDRGIVLAKTLIETMRQQHIIVPAIDVIERMCGEALTRGTRMMFKALIKPLAEEHHRALEQLLAHIGLCYKVAVNAATKWPWKNGGIHRVFNRNGST